MNGYLQNDYNASRVEDGNHSQNSPMMMMGQEGMDGGMMGGGQTLDEIVNRNAKAMRRQSMPQQYGGQQNNTDTNMRRISMMDYSGSSPAGPMGNFQYDPAGSQRGMMSGNATPTQNQQQQQQQNDSRHQSNADLSLQTSFPDGSQSFNPMMQPTSTYQSPAHQQVGYEMSMNSPYVDNSMGMQMDYSVDQNLGNSQNANPQQMNMYNQQQQFNQGMMQSPMHYNGSQTPLSSRPPLQNPDGGSRNSSYTTTGGHPAAQALSRRHSSNQTSPAQGGMSPPGQQASSSAPQNQHMQGFSAPIQQADQDQELGNASRRNFDGLNGPTPVQVNARTWNPNNQSFDWETPEGGWPSTMTGRPHMQTSYKNAYSSTGFDMLGVLMRVATRPNPEISIGSVDLSCAFVVCDAERDDCPIVYCSDNFERLTGYTKHMILGRNCRFLQSPDGNVEPGKRRKYVDDDSVLYLKNMINLQRESQISLINYRRGGQPFMNLLTMIPIAWESDTIKFFVGFQVDLVEQPNAVTNKNPDGSYAINYQRGVTMPRYVLSAPENSQKMNLGQTVPRDEVSTIISTIGSGESDYAKRMWDKVLLENTDDVIHVLSLKGLFQWVSPSALRVLEYEPSELVGTALSSVCHPSDIVPVTRELKDTSSGVSVNVVFRIRRKNSGYMWFEGNGSLHTEQGKGRKSIILVGRERPVYTLSKNDIVNAGGIGENELWTKMSTSGMFLFVSSNVRQLLDRQPEELIGVSIQSLMRADSKTEFGRILEHARNGKKASVKHELINRRGQVLSAFTTLYPGDATEGLKPTFILAQTRLIKFTRGPTAQRTSIFPKQEHSTPDGVQSPAAQSSTPAPTTTSAGGQTPRNQQHVNTDTSAVTFSGQQGLQLGHQDQSLASDDNLFDELKTTKSSSWQYEIRQLEKRNRMLAEEVQALIAAKKKRKRRRGKDQQKDCANCHTRVTPEWRRGPSGQRDLCNSCGLRWAKINGRVSPRAGSAASAASDKASKASKASASASPRHPGGHASSTPSGIKTESPGNVPSAGGPSHSATPATPAVEGGGAGGGGAGGALTQQSPRAVKPNPPEGHGASMEGAHGVPDRIEEGVEPGD